MSNIIERSTIDFIPLLKTYVPIYQKDKNAFIDMLASTAVPIQVIEACYNLFVRTKEIEPIEQLSQEQKNKIWARVKGKMKTKEAAIQISKCLYLLDRITD